jgi:hypothetical protein
MLSSAWDRSAAPTSLLASFGWGHLAKATGFSRKAGVSANRPQLELRSSMFDATLPGNYPINYSDNYRVN